MSKKIEYKCVYINQFILLLKKLFTRGLLNSKGGLLEIEKYCQYEHLRKIDWKDKIIYSGILIEELKDLTDYELAMLMAGEDVIAYKVKRKYPNNYFLVIIYK